MLVANAFGIPVVERAYPTLVGLGAIIAGSYTEGVCANGADFICNVKDGLYSCRPCAFEQLGQFKELQHRANRLATKFEFGRDKLTEVDGRIATVTARLVGLVSGRLSAVLTPPLALATAIAAAKSDPTAHDTFRQISAFVPEFVQWFGAGIAMVDAPESYPTPPALPRAQPGGDGPVTVPTTTPTLPVPAPKSRMKAAGMFVGVLGVLTAIGLVATA